MYENLVGQKFGKWTIKRITKFGTMKNTTECECICECGTVALHKLSSIYYGTTTMCPKCKECNISKIAIEKAKQHIGEKHGKLTILDVVNYRAGEGGRKKGYNKFLCRCDCGKEKEIVGYRVLNGETISCGCATKVPSQHRLDIKNLLGQKFGHLTLVGEEDYDWKKGTHKYCFSCDCGSGRIIKGSLYDVKHGKILSCGCQKSEKQVELHNYIKSFCPNIIQNYYFEPRGIQIDVYVPEKKLGFEFNGCYYHSIEQKERLYHFKKKKYYAEKGINIIYIREDEWDSKKDLVKDYIKTRLGICKNIGARQLDIKNITYTEYYNFCEENHLQGASKKISICYGGFLNGELICVAGFDIKGVMDRYCIKRGYSVNGGLMRFCKKYFKEYNKDIITYANLDIVDINNNIYEKYGFQKKNLDFGGFYIQKKQVKRKHKYRLYDRSLKSKLGIKKIDDNVLKDYYHCIGAGIQKYVLHLD